MTRVHRVVQYFPKATFADFADEVTRARCGGDANPDEKILSDCYKLMGNSSYGKTICNKQKHSCDKYVKGRSFELLTNSWRFKKGVEVADNLYKVKLQPKSVNNDFPIQIEAVSTFKKSLCFNTILINLAYGG